MTTSTLLLAASLTLLHAGPAPAPRPTPPRPQPDARPPPAPAVPGPMRRPASNPSLRNAIVTVRVTAQDWDFKAPWSKTAPRTRSFSGVVVEGNAILVTAVGLGNQTAVEVQRPGEETRFDAQVRIVDHEASLALLDVPTPAFWQGLVPLTVGDDVPPEADVTIHRWLGNNQFETARASVKQVRVGDHGIGRVQLLTYDLATTMTNAGASEPVLMDGHIVGLCTARGENTVAAIGAPVLQQFLREAARKPYRGFARLGVGVEKLLNPALRAHLGLKPDEGGVLVTRVLPHGSAAGTLEPGDVLLELAGQRLDESAQYEHPRHGKLAFALLVTLGRAPGEKLPARILRAGKRQAVELTLRRMDADDDRVPPYVVDRAPEYLVRGGLVFQALTVPYLRTFGDWRRRAPAALSIAQELKGDDPRPGAERMVVLTDVLPDPVNLGFQDEGGLLVRAVNGKAVTNLQELREAFRAEPPGGFHVVEFEPGQSLTRLVLEAAELDAAHERIRALYGLDSLGG